MNKTGGNTQLYSLISKSIVAIAGSLIMYFIVAFCILQFYSPDVEAAISKSRELIVNGGGNPEPVESLLFQMGVVLIPLSIALFFWIFSLPKLAQIKWERFFKPLSVCFVLFTIVVLFAGFSANNPNYVEDAVGNNYANSRDLTHSSNFSFYFAESMLSQNTGAVVFVFLFLIVLPFVAFKFYPKVFENKIMKYLGLILVCGYALFYLFQLYQIFQFDFPHTWENKYDFNVVYYPMTQVYAGSPMLVDGFSANYGLYSHFLNPVFKLTGLSVSSFTAVMALLIVASCAMIFVSMMKTIKTKLIVLLGFASMLYITILLPRIVIPFDATFAMFPIRQLIPAVAICLSTFYLYNKKKLLYFVSFILLSMSTLWNPEFGIVCFLSWVIMLCYMEFKSSDKRTILIGCAKHLLTALASVLLVFLSYSLMVYLAYGEFPELIKLFDSMLYFGSLGVGMLPMTAIHLWNFVILIYIVGLVYAIQALFDKSKMNEKTALVLLLSVMGVGMFFYFQGRSHNWTLVAVIINAFFLLAIFADLLFEKIKQKTVPLSFYAGFVVILFVLNFSFCDLFSYQSKLTELKSQNKDKRANMEEQQMVKANIDYIKSLLPETSEKIYIHTSNKYQSLYFGPTKKQSAFNPSIIDIFTYENCNRLKDKILVDSYDVFLEPRAFYYYYVQPANAATTATYSVEASNNAIVYMKKRKYDVLSSPILEENSNQVLFYQKFKDDTASLNQRVNYAIEGAKPITWNDNFSVEMVFYAEQQAYLGGTIFSNNTDTTGICLLNNRDPELYYLRWNSDLGIMINVPKNQWNYLVLQFTNNTVAVYLNGSLINSADIPQAPKQSVSNLFIANSSANNLHFTGAISEILFKNGHSSATEMQKKTENFKKLTHSRN